MDLAQATNAIRDKVQGGFDLSNVVKFDLGDDGVIVIDGAASPASVGNQNREADVTITVSLADFGDILRGAQNAQMAFMAGKLQVAGDMSIAMRLAQIL